MENRGLTLDEYQQRAMTTCTESSKNDTYLLFGLVAEVGELADKVAKAKPKEYITIDEDEIFPKSHNGTIPLVFEEFTESFIKELGDVLWFVALIAKHAGLSLEEVAQLNLDKLADRAKRGVIVGNGDNR